MKTKVVAGSAILFLFCCNAVWAQWPAQTYARQTYELELGARIFDRPGTTRNTPLVTNSVTLQTVFNAEQATDLDVSGGAEFRIQKAGDYNSTWEIRGFFDSWDVSDSFSGPLEAFDFTPPGVPVGTQLTAFDYDYDSEIFNIEWNCKRAIHPGCTVFVGPRYLNLDETVGINSVFNAPGFPSDFLTTFTSSNTSNNMIGLNLGCELRRPISRDLFINGSVRGAIMYNKATATLTNSQTLFGAPLSTITLMDDNKGTSAGIGEVSVKLHYDVAPGFVSIFAGYQAMWIDGAALAPTQVLEVIGNPGPRVVETGTTIFAHGLIVGGMCRF